MYTIYTISVSFEVFSSEAANVIGIFVQVKICYISKEIPFDIRRQ